MFKAFLKLTMENFDELDNIMSKDTIFGTGCKAFLCKNENHSGGDYCPYHQQCLSKLREKENISNSEILRLETFETWFNGNCGYVVIERNASFFIWLVIYEPALRDMKENLEMFKYSCPSADSSPLEAQQMAKQFKVKLQNGGWYDTPILEIHSRARNWRSFYGIITSPYVKKEEVGNWDSTHCILFVHGSGTTPYDLDRHFKPLDIVKIKEVERILGTTFYHVGIYLGDVGDGKRICHFSRKSGGVRLASWNDFLKDRIGELYRYHSIIPFKYPQRIAEQIAWSYSSKFREGNYDLYNRNCEHFANMIVYGINYSEQIEDKKATLKIAESVYHGTSTSGYLIASTVLTPFTMPLAAFTIKAGMEIKFNNDKGSTIKLIDEMSESNGELRERDNSLSYRIKANIEVPPKEHCRIM